MTDELRRPFFIIALVLMFLVVLVEIGSPWLQTVTSKDFDRPGYGVQYLVFVDAFLFYVSLLIGLALIIPERIQGRLQGIATLIVSFFGCLGIIGAIIFALIFLLVLVTLLLAPIFGTAAYLAIYGNFDRGGANITLSLIMFLKIGYCIFLVLAHQRFLQNKSLVLLTLTSLLANIIIGFLHNFVPGILVSITDALGAIVVAILALIWAIIFLIGSIIAIVKSIR
ncbi:MAG TPA: hypothetical protein VF599_16820 [Pyrinomonadaceae bacterium]|jgi:hypothetical protein